MKTLNKFLGTARWQSLVETLRLETSISRVPEVNTVHVLLSLAVATTPVLLTLLDELTPDSRSSLPTFGFGIAAALAILIRWKLKIPFHLPTSWRRSLNLTHTAVALGCIPAVLVILLSPQLLAERHDLLTEAIQPAGPPGSQPKILNLVGLVLLIALWVSVVEEVIFRGLIVSVVRRWPIFQSQAKRDVTAAVLSALIFGIAHYATWGPAATVALVGLGIGFALAYIATGEQLAPVVIYHFIFDALSIGITVFN